MKLEVPINVDIDDVTKLIHDLQCLQTYKLGVNDTMVLVSLDDVADVFADHIRAKRLDKDIDVPSKWIPVSEKLPQSDPEDLEYPTVIICSPNGSVELGCFYESTKEWGAGENFDRLRNPVAWMPLPEPYKEGE